MASIGYAAIHWIVGGADTNGYFLGRGAPGGRRDPGGERNPVIADRDDADGAGAVLLGVETRPSAISSISLWCSSSCAALVISSSVQSSR
jgi:hypothetical protein